MERCQWQLLGPTRYLAISLYRSYPAVSRCIGSCMCYTISNVALQPARVSSDSVAQVSETTIGVYYQKPLSAGSTTSPYKIALRGMQVPESSLNHPPPWLNPPSSDLKQQSTPRLTRTANSLPEPWTTGSPCTLVLRRDVWRRAARAAPGSALRQSEAARRQEQRNVAPQMRAATLG